MTQLELDKLILETYSFEKGLKPILDGIINEDKFNSCIPKILWILKEPYDLGDGLGGWDSRIDINGATETYFKYRTWKRIAYSSYGIINKVPYEKAKEDPHVCDILKSISYINLSKFPAGTTSGNRWEYFGTVYNKCKSVIWDQIDFYNPDIIIIGNITYLFLPYLNLTWKDQIPLPLMNKGYYYYKDKLIIDAYHPSVPPRWINEKNYCNAIIETGINWLSK